MMWADIPLTYSTALHGQDGTQLNSGQSGERGQLAMK